MVKVSGEGTGVTAANRGFSDLSVRVTRRTRGCLRQSALAGATPDWIPNETCDTLKSTDKVQI